MPAVSEAQRKWAFANKGADWAKKHHFDNKGKLPERVEKKRAGNAKAAQRRIKKKRRTAPGF
jgi:hypothetical protein